MLIDNFKALTIFEKNIERNYVEYSDLKAILKSNEYLRKYYAENNDEIYCGNYVSLTEFEDEILIDIINSSIDVINEAVQFALLTKKKIYFGINQSNINDLRANYQISIINSTGHEHYGIYGCLKEKNTLIIYNNKIEISNVYPEDIKRIRQLSPKEWGNLPTMIQYMKNLNHMFIAKIDNDYVGYLNAASSHSNYMDIAMIFVHPNKRKQGVASCLIKRFIDYCFQNFQKPYYGTANTKESALLAESIGFKKIMDTKQVYLLENTK